MSRGVRQEKHLREKTQRLLEGPLKHVKAAALAAALLPLASVAAAPAAAQTPCVDPSSGTGLCGFVWDDANNNGIQDDGADSGLEGVTVFIDDGSGEPVETTTGLEGHFFVSFPESPTTTFTISVLIPGGQPSPTDVPTTTDTFDSDGVLSDAFSVAAVTGTGFATDFGFFTPPVIGTPPPGTGTPGYWKNHPEAWPASMSNITVGGVTYTKAQAIEWLKKTGKDKSVTMFHSLVSAMLNVEVGNEDSCVADTITAANAWMALHPVGSNVAGSSDAWSGSEQGEQMHQLMDAYNNGLLCADHRN
jgi:hypothetical protein